MTSTTLSPNDMYRVHNLNPWANLSSLSVNKRFVTSNNVIRINTKCIDSEQIAFLLLFSNKNVGILSFFSETKASNVF